MQNLLNEAKQIEADIIADRRIIHQNPEIGMDLPMTTAHIMKRLREMGYEPQEICQSGVVATVGKPGKTFLLRGDTDALPMKEMTDLPFRSENGWAHSCGHDTHAAMLLGAAKLLKEHEDELEGTVKLMFQPAEEILAGAKAMVEAGLLENPKVDAALGIHISSVVKKGVASYCDKYVNASADKFVINIKGKGGHGASPESAIDPINAACHVHLALQALNSREVSGRDLAVITIGHFASGDKENIIPETAMMEGTIRCYDSGVRAFLKERLVQVATTVAAAFRCECTVDYPFGVAPNENNVQLQNECIGYVKELIGDENILCEEGSMGSEDFSYVSSNVPSLFITLGARVADDDKVFPAHSPNVLFDEDAFHVGSAIYTHVAMEWLKNNK